MGEPPSQPAAEFHRGVKEGRVDALLEQHSEHLAQINGSVARAGLAAEALTTAVNSLTSDTTASLIRLEQVLRDALADVASDVRTLNEDARVRDQVTEATRAALAAETERRRVELGDMAAAGSSRFTRRQQLAALTLTVLGLVVSYLLLYLTLRPR